MGWLQLFDKNGTKTSLVGEQKSILILIVDDEVQITTTLSRYLALEDFMVITANDGQEGLKKYQERKPDIIITDIRMPRMSGLQLLESIRREDTETEIIVATGHGDMESAITALKSQASDFISKPIDFEVLMLALNRAVSRLDLRHKVKAYTAELEKLLKQVNYSKEYMEAIVQNSPHALLTYDIDGKILTWNDEAEKITGFSANDAIGSSLRDLFILESHLIDQSFREKNESNLQNIIAQVLTKNQEIRFISRNANVIKGEGSSIVGGIESFIDITEQLKNDRLLEKRYMQVQTINEIGKTVASSTELTDLSMSVCHHLVSTFFESSQVTLFLYNSEKDKLILRAMDGNNIERVKERYPIGSSFETDQGVVGKTFSSGEPMIVDDVKTCGDFLEGSSEDITSEVAFPIRSIDKTLGVLNIENTEKIPMDESDRFMLEAIAEYLGVSIERIELLEKITLQNQLLEEQADNLKQALVKVESQKEIIEQQNIKLINDLKKAADFQKSLLPVELPEYEQIKFAATYIPSSQLGGDYYDVFEINENLVGLILADASGHGVAAAMLSAMFKMTLQKYAADLLNPAQVFHKLNEDFCKVLQMGEFFTGFYAILDRRDNKLVYSNAAHPRPLLYNYETKEVRQLDTNGFLLGIMEAGISYEKKEGILNGRYRLLIYTDGVNEAFNENGEQYGDDRIKKSLMANCAEDPHHFLSRIKKDLTEYTQSEMFDDDVTMLVMDLVNDN